LARIVARVFTVERLPDLLVEAEERFRRLGCSNIETRLGDGALGWPSGRRSTAFWSRPRRRASPPPCASSSHRADGSSSRSAMPWIKSWWCCGVPPRVRGTADGRGAVRAAHFATRLPAEGA